MWMPDENLFNRMKTLNATGAAKAVKKSLNDSCAVAMLESFTHSWNAGMESQWGTLARALEVMDAEQASENPHLIDNMRGIIDLCWKRTEDEAKAAMHFQNEEALGLWRVIGHLQATTIKPWIKRWIASARLTADVDVESFTAVYGRWWGLVQAVRAVQEFSWVNPPDPSPAAVEAVLLFILKRKNVPEPEVDIFGKCKLCWRSVPLAKSTCQNNLQCQFHQWNTNEYKRALRLHNETDHFMLSMEAGINTLHKRSRKHWVTYHNNLPQN